MFVYCQKKPNEQNIMTYGKQKAIHTSSRVSTFLFLSLIHDTWIHTYMYMEPPRIHLPDYPTFSLVASSFEFNYQVLLSSFLCKEDIFKTISIIIPQLQYTSPNKAKQSFQKQNCYVRLVKNQAHKPIGEIFLYTHLESPEISCNPEFLNT